MSQSAQKPEPPARPRRKRRLLLKIGLVVVVLLVLLVVFLPMLASTGLVRRMVLSSVNGGIKGKVEVADWSLSWFGPCRVEGLAVSDKAGRRTLAVKSVEWDRGLWHALGSMQALGRIDLKSPDVTLYLNSDGTNSLAGAFESVKPKAQPAVETKAAPSLPSVAVTLTGARVRIVRPDGREFTVLDASGSLDVKSINDLGAKLSARLPGDSKLLVDASLKDLAKGGTIRLDDATGSLKVQTDRPVDLGPLFAFAMTDVHASGSAALDLSVEVAPSGTTATCRVSVAGLAVSSLADVKAIPADAELSADATYVGGKLKAGLVFTSAVGKLVSTVNYNTAGPTGASAAEVLEALLAGKSVELPDFSLDAKGHVDLAKAAESVPGLLRLRKDARVESGSLELANVKLRGGKSPWAEGAATLKLTTSRAGVRKAWEPMELDFKVVSDEAGRLVLEKASFISPFADLVASGTPAKGGATFHAWLGATRSEFADVLDVVDVAPAGLTAASVREMSYVPDDTELSGTVTYDSSVVTGNVNVLGTIGSITSDVRYVVARGPEFSKASLLEALRDGKAAELPDFAVGVKGKIDLAVASRSAPGLLRLRKDVELRSGTLVLNDVKVRGGKTPSAEGGVTLTMTTSRAGKSKVWQPMELTFKVTSDVGATGGRPYVEKAVLKSSFATLDASGTPEKCTATFRAKIGDVKREFADVLDVVDVSPAGMTADSVREMQTVPDDTEVAGDLSYGSSTLAGTVNVTGEIGSLTSDVRYVVAKMPDVSAQKVVDALVDGKCVELPEFSLDVKGTLDLAVAARSAPELLKLRKDVEIRSGTLQLAALKLRGGKTPSAEGDVTLNLTTSRGGATRKWEPMTAGFRVTSDVERTLKVERASLKSLFANFNASGTLAELDADFRANLATLRGELADVFDLEGVTLAGDVSGTVQSRRDARNTKLTRLVLDVKADGVSYAAATPAQPAKKQPEPARITGRLKWDGTLEQDAESTRLAGRAEIPEMNVTGYEGVFRGERATLTHNVTMRRKEDRIDIAQFVLDSKLLSLDLTGRVSKLQTDCLLDLTGKYSSSWDELNALLKQFSPETAKSLAMTGESAGDIRVNGPARRPELKPAFQQMGGRTAFGWKAGSRLYGLTTGDAKFAPELKGAEVILPVSVIAANGGTVRLGGRVDLRGDDPVLSIPGELAVLQNVGLNEDVGRDILSRALPLLGELGRLEGTVSLTVKDVKLPLSSRIRTAGSGSGRLDLSNLRLEPAGEFARVLQFCGTNPNATYLIRVSAVDFEFKDGGISYKNLKLVIGELDLEFHGTVRFDDTVDLVVSVPVRAGLLESLGVKGQALQIAKALEGTRIDVPVTGSRSKPKVDFGKVDVGKLLKKNLKKGVGGLLEELGHF